jgi:hypothetical protein
VTLMGRFAAGAPLPPGAGCGFTLRYAPGENAPAAAQAELRVEFGTIARATTVQLRGTAGAVAAPTFSATGLSFPAQAVGSTSAPQRVDLVNTGQAVLALSAITTGGAAAGDFAVDGSCRPATQLAPGAQCALEVRFAPTVTASGGEGGGGAVTPLWAALLLALALAFGRRSRLPPAGRRRARARG